MKKTFEETINNDLSIIVYDTTDVTNDNFFVEKDNRECRKLLSLRGVEEWDKYDNGIPINWEILITHNMPDEFDDTIDKEILNEIYNVLINDNNIPEYYLVTHQENDYFISVLGNINKYKKYNISYKKYKIHIEELFNLNYHEED